MSGERVILDEVLKQHNQSRAPNLSPDKFFEVFSVDQILKDQDLSYEDIQAGIFDGPNDAGIDWAYIVLNGSVVNIEEEIVLPEKGELDIILFVGQSKNQDAFKETPVDVMKSRLEVLLKLQVEPHELKGIKEDLVNFFCRFSAALP